MIKKTRKNTIKYNKTQLENLMALANKLGDEINLNEDQKNLPSLAKQYRETLNEIERLESIENVEDEISTIIKSRNIRQSSSNYTNKSKLS